jgi:DNA-directed RNA polymerase specialized sigma24 family protein
MRWFKPRLLAPSCVEPDAGQGEAAASTQEELARIFVQIRPSLERVIERKTGNHQVAQDLAQEMFFRLQRVAHSLSKEEEARRYLMRMATNAAIDHLRVEGNRLQLLAGAIGSAAEVSRRAVSEPHRRTHAHRDRRQARRVAQSGGKICGARVPALQAQAGPGLSGDRVTGNEYENGTGPDRCRERRNE